MVVILVVVDVLVGDRLVGLVMEVCVRLRVWILVCMVFLKLVLLFGKVCVSVKVVWFLDFISVILSVVWCVICVLMCICEWLCLRVLMLLLVICSFLLGLSLVLSMIMVVSSLVSEVIGMMVLGLCVISILLVVLLMMRICLVLIGRCSCWVGGVFIWFVVCVVVGGVLVLLWLWVCMMKLVVVISSVGRVSF